MDRPLVQQSVMESHEEMAGSGAIQTPMDGTDQPASQTALQNDVENMTINDNNPPKPAPTYDEVNPLSFDAFSW